MIKELKDKIAYNNEFSRRIEIEHKNKENGRNGEAYSNTSSLQHAHQANKVSLAMMDLIIDFVIPENFSTFIAEKVVPLSLWFPTAKKIKKTEAKAFNTTSRILFKKPKMVYYFIA